MREIFEYTFLHGHGEKHRVTTWSDVYEAALTQYPEDPVVANKIVLIIEGGNVVDIGNQYATVAVQVTSTVETWLEYHKGKWTVGRSGSINRDISYESLYDAFAAWAELVNIPFNPMDLCSVKVSRDMSSFEPIEAAETFKPKPEIERPQTFGAWS